MALVCAKVDVIDWAPVIHAHRQHRAVRLRAGRTFAISVERVWRAVIEASAPLRLGTRFRAVPDVRLFTGDELVISPGERLPGAGDHSLDDYVARTPGSFQLVVTHPLVIDFALWADVRALVHGLFARIGAPVLPVVCELVLGRFDRSPRGFTKRMDHAVVTVVLAGELRVRLLRRGRHAAHRRLLDREAALLLNRLLTDRSDSPALDGAAREVITEVGNIVLNACLGAFGNLLKVQVTFTVPHLRIESVHKVLNSITIEGDELEYALIIHTRFHMRASDVSGYLVIILGVTSLATLLQELTKWEERELR